MIDARSRTHWALRAGALLVVWASAFGVVIADPAEAAKRRKGGAKAADLIHPFLGPAYSSWLVGPIAALATDQEIARFLELSDDPAAARFIEEFWDRRDPEPEFPGNPLREDFEERVQEADRRFEEGMTPGHRTERGTLFVLYGEPTEQRIDYPRRPGRRPPRSGAMGTITPWGSTARSRRSCTASRRMRRAGSRAVARDSSIP